MLEQLKPYLAAPLLPPLAPLLLVILGLLLLRSRQRLWGAVLAVAGTGALWLLGCTAVGIWLNTALLPAYPMASPGSLVSARVQAIVVLGGGTEMGLPDGVSQLSPASLDRLRYGVELARATGVPLLFSGGAGWGSKSDAPQEADVAARVAQDAFGVQVRWKEDRSRDTRENATQSYRVLAPERVTRIALVTHSWHMPRSVQEFERAGFKVVVPAPMGQPTSSLQPVLQWLPSVRGLAVSSAVIRERLALLVSR